LCWYCRKGGHYPCGECITCTDIKKSYINYWVIDINNSVIFINNFGIFVKKDYVFWYR
jgi:hypothetical protein